MFDDELPLGIDDDARSEAWSSDENPADKPVVSVHVASYRRGDLLPDLFVALEDQNMARSDFEVVVVDDASGDGTWERLRRLVEATPLRARCLRLARNSGPATARNTAVSVSGADILAFTDDDCIPERGWLSALTASMADAHAVVQGRVLPPHVDSDEIGPWDHTIRVNGLTPFFETCNIAYRRDDFDAAGGFDISDPLLHPGEGMHFGEDAVLGSRVVGSGVDRCFADDAVVFHRYIPQSFREHLRAQRKVKSFPGLARRSPIFASRLQGGLFLSRRSAAFDLAAVSIGVASLARQPWALVGTVPWARLAFRAAGTRTTSAAHKPRVIAGVGLTDLVTFVSLLEGSIRYRRPIL